MREIKFRAWDKEAKVWYSMGALSLPIGKMSEEAERIGYTLVQFTGRHDKNGKEIYEGDVLRWRGSRNLEIRWGTVGWVLYGDLFAKGALEADSCFEFNTKGYLTHSEIIGNVHQNPELLTN